MTHTMLRVIAGATALGVVAVGVTLPSHYDYWDAHHCVNHLDGSIYEGTADKLSQFPQADVCKEYVHHIN